jgi:DNA polymerase III subunit delta'
MADENLDPRETEQHPRHAKRVLGHDASREQFQKAFQSGKPHHAWMLIGAEGIGKATLAYKLASYVLNDDVQTKSWIAARTHPDLFVLERQLGKTKPPKLKGEISVDETRELLAFFSRTSSRGGWRVAIVDCVDDLNSESSNALLKLVEEPPPKCLLFLLVNQPGRVLRTLRSRCTKLAMSSLEDQQVAEILQTLGESADDIVTLSDGSPGRVLQLKNSEAAKAFDQFRMQHQRRAPKTQEARLAIINRFGQRGPSNEDMHFFGALLGQWIAREARCKASKSLADCHQTIATNLRIAEGYNLDRKLALLDALKAVDAAL